MRVHLVVRWCSDRRRCDAGEALTLQERRFIEATRRDGLSLRAIGRELGRAHTTISGEVDGNRQALNGAYRSVVAEHRSARGRGVPSRFG